MLMSTHVALSLHISTELHVYFPFATWLSIYQLFPQQISTYLYHLASADFSIDFCTYSFYLPLQLILSMSLYLTLHVSSIPFFPYLYFIYLYVSSTLLSASISISQVSKITTLLLKIDINNQVSTGSFSFWSARFWPSRENILVNLRLDEFHSAETCKDAASKGWLEERTQQESKTPAMLAR